MKQQNNNFQDALKTASFWCRAWDEGELSDEVLADKIGNLLTNKESARGFFVISLTSESPLMDRIPEPIIFELIKGGEFIVDLIVKNLAMSTAMEIFHQRKNDSDQKNTSHRIKVRCIDLLKVLDSKSVKDRLVKLLEGLKGNGEDVYFIKKWGYDSEQISAISESINAVANK
ncbi:MULTISPECIES: hypothetical protein [Prochlorococcus]|uniref:hypothetical protein n=1 Tax=Prochlorococcus TaxID=1218 RepID=UPI0005338697|nr:MULTISPECIES: hypothetical protein [Prochlorococcus]KGG12004.1 hypothetical protein EV05_1207 [Prochlorococcus sp. MIT 0601]